MTTTTPDRPVGRFPARNSCPPVAADAEVLVTSTGAILALALAIAGSLPASALAQQDPAEELIEEIVVTAGFRDSELMVSPGSTTVIGEVAIEDRAARHLESVLNTAANVNYSSGASRARFLQVRGVGDLEQFLDPKHFPSVGIRVDDIDLGSAANAAMLFDQEQVEFLRGPQGTKFGTSALAGMVNIRGNRPTESFGGYGQVGAGDYGSWHAGGAISGPLSNTASARLAVLRNRSDGYIDNVHLGRDDTNGHDETSVRATLEFAPADGAAYGLTALYFDGRNGYDAFSLDNTRETLSDQPGRDNQETFAVAARGEWRLGETVTLETVATRLDSDLEYGFDEDWTFQGICDGTLCHPEYDFFSNTDNYSRDRGETSLDVRLLSDIGSTDRTRYVLGGLRAGSGRGSAPGALRGFLQLLPNRPSRRLRPVGNRFQRAFGIDPRSAVRGLLRPLRRHGRV